MAHKPYGVLYVGVTTDLPKRVWQHKNKIYEGFTSRYHVTQLVWYEQHQNIENAIYKEKQMKKWKREYKLNVINSINPEWKDLYQEIV